MKRGSPPCAVGRTLRLTRRREAEGSGSGGVPQCILCRFPHKLAAFLAAEHGKEAGALVLDVPSGGVADGKRVRLRVGGGAHSIGATVRGVVLECFRREGSGDVRMVDDLRCSFDVEKSELAWLPSEKEKHRTLDEDDDDPLPSRVTATIYRTTESPQTMAFLPQSQPERSKETQEHAEVSAEVSHNVTAAAPSVKKTKTKTAAVVAKEKKPKKAPKASVTAVSEDVQTVVPEEDEHEDNTTEKEPEDALVIRNAAEYNMYAELFSQKHARYNVVLDFLEHCRGEVRGLEAVVATAQAQRLPLDVQKAREHLANYERANFATVARRLREARRLHRALVRMAAAMEVFVRHHDAEHTLPEVTD